ncbi:MAG: hypothetical protein LBF27_06195 [Sphingobacterium sp.]|jgi:hypothetical protein|nr:hypothetical protein [Sphingobacterium sp.]
MNILFIHGRAQEEYTQDTLLRTWTSALKESFVQTGLDYPNFELALPYYGKELIRQRDIYKKDIEDGILQMRAAKKQDKLEELEKKLLLKMLENAGVSQKEITDEVNSAQQTKGAENLGISIVMARLIDRHFKSVANGCVKKRTEDVVTYLIAPKAREVINKFYLDALTPKPTVIIAHSMGTIIAYDILRNLDKKQFDIRGLITLGSPLGVESVQRQLMPPPVYPKALKGSWVNMFDPRDIVALNPLDPRNFRVDNRQIINHEITNTSDNRHKISEYLSNPLISETLMDMINE